MYKTHYIALFNSMRFRQIIKKSGRPAFYIRGFCKLIVSEIPRWFSSPIYATNYFTKHRFVKSGCRNVVGLGIVFRPWFSEATFGCQRFCRLTIVRKEKDGITTDDDRTSEVSNRIC